MNVLLSHIDLNPLFYGVLVAIGIMIVGFHLGRGKIGAVITDIAIFTLVFWLHKGSLTGGMAATVAALICGVLLPPMIVFLINRRK